MIRGGVVLLAALLASQQAAAADPKHANFARERASTDTRQVADWVVSASDNHNLPFAIVDKKNAKVFVFDAHGQLRGAAPALIGETRGDDSVPGIGEREIASIRTEEKTTPAGRFVAVIGGNMRGEDVLWVDYAGAVAMHRVLTTNPAERRLQRLATPTASDNRISFGCINVPAKFYENVVRPAFTGTDGIVYVLPDTKPLHAVFAMPPHAVFAMQKQGK
ncbi:MAG: L,D-transpeptidase [Betaproteobacteria bacterium]